LAPSVTRFSRTSGVPPIDWALSLKSAIRFSLSSLGRQADPAAASCNLRDGRRMFK
jgi:hypothetical protein